MNIAEQMLLDTRRQFLSRAARTVRWAALVFTFFCLIVLLLAPSLSIAIRN